MRSGKIIAPACADPFIMATVVTQVLFDEQGKYLDQSVREEVIQNNFFKVNYKKATTLFKDSADQFLSELRSKFDVYIVTNSDTTGVTQKIQQLSANHTTVPIYGNARKYNLCPDWNDVPESVDREGFARPLFLQRKQYWDVLQQIMEEKGVAPDQVAVVGDIYELDLLLPEYKNMRIILTPRENTANFELTAVETSPKGFVTRDLEKVVEYLAAHK